MSSVVEIVLRMKDMLSGGVKAAAQRSGRSIDDLNTRLDHLKKERRTMVNSDSIIRANREIDSLERKMRGIERMGISATAHGATSMWSMAKGTAIGAAISTGLSQVVGGISGFVRDSIQAAMDAASRAKSFEVLTGSEARGKQLFNELRHLKQSTIMGASVYSNAQTLMGFGIPDSNVIRVLKQIGDVAMGDTERMRSLSLAYAQTGASGKLMGQDLLQYINAGFNPLSVMAEKWKQFGFRQKVTVGQLKELMSQGKISAIQVAKAFEVATSEGGQFYRMMEKTGQTPGGKLLKLEGNLAALKIDVGNQLMPIAVAAMDRINQLLHWMERNNIVSKMQPYVDGTINAFKFLTENIAKSASMFKEASTSFGGFLDMLGIGKGKKSIVVPSDYDPNPPFFEWDSDRKERLRRRNMKIAGTPYISLPVPFIESNAQAAARKEKERKANLWAIGFDGRFKASPQRGDLYASVPKSSDSVQKTKAQKQEAGIGLSPVNDSIVGGGGKKIEIRIGNVVGQMHITGATPEERGHNMEVKLKETIYRIFAGLPA